MLLTTIELEPLLLKRIYFLITQPKLIILSIKHARVGAVQLVLAQT